MKSVGGGLVGDGGLGELVAVGGRTVGVGIGSVAVLSLRGGLAVCGLQAPRSSKRVPRK